MWAPLLVGLGLAGMIFGTAFVSGTAGLCGLALLLAGVSLRIWEFWHGDD